MLKLNSQSILTLINVARIDFASGNSSKAAESLRQAIHNIAGETKLQELVVLATELNNQKLFDEAVLIYEKYVNPNQDTKYTRQFITACFSAGQHDKALVICTKLVKKIGPDSFLSEIISAIHEKNGNLDEAKRVCTECLQVFPKDVRMQLRLAVINYRKRDTGALSAFLKQNIDITTFPFSDALILAQLHFECGDKMKAVQIMYELQRKHYDLPDAHLKYMGMMFNTPVDSVSFSHNPIEVEIDSAVLLSDVAGNPKWYIIEQRDNPNSNSGEINSRHPFAQKLLGLKVGDAICISQGSGRSETIKAIKSKYIHALHQSMDTFNILFPDRTDFIAMRLPISREPGSIPEAMQTMIRNIKARHKSASKIIELYKTGQATLGSTAKLLERSVVDIWYGLIFYPEVGVRCCIGNPIEWNNARNCMTKSSKIVIDCISLLTIHELQIADFVASKFGKLYLVQSTLDLFLDAIKELERCPAEAFLGVTNDGRPTYNKIQPEQIERNLKNLRQIVLWIDINCEIVSIPISDNTHKVNSLRNLIGQAFADSIFAAKAYNALLFSDDLGLRALAKNESGVDGIWTQVLLKHAADNEMLHKSDYTKLVAKLVNLNYHYISVGVDEIVEVAKQSSWFPTDSFKRILTNLDEQSCEAQAGLFFAVNCIYALYRQTILDSRRDNLVFTVINSFMQKRPRVVLSEFEKAIRVRFILEPLEEQKVLAILKVWAVTQAFK